MEESATYRAIILRGRIEAARHLLLLQGKAKLGPPNAATQTALEKISDIDQLEEIAVLLMSADGWNELLPPSRQRRQNGRCKANA